MASSNEDPSLSQLQRETEQSRAELVQTVDALRTRVAGTADDIKSRMSPTAIKEEVKDYVRDTGQQWYATIERQAKENPLQAVAIAAGVAYPAFKILKSLPAPLLLIGAGIALSRSSGKQSAHYQTVNSGRPGIMDRVQSQVEGVSASLTNKAGEAVQGSLAAASDRISDMTERAGKAVSNAGSSISSTVSGMTSAVHDASAGATGAIGTAVETVRHGGAEAVNYVTEQADYLTNEATHQVRRAQQSLGDIIEQNPLLVGGLGLALGMLIAGALPVTRPENELLGGASRQLKDQARGMIAQGAEAVREVAQQTYDETTKIAEHEGLTSESVRKVVAGVRDKVGEVTSRVIGSETDKAPASSEPPFIKT